MRAYDEHCNKGAAKDVSHLHPFFYWVDMLTAISSESGQEMCMNVYDVRKYDTVPACGMNWPEDLADATKYLDVCLYILREYKTN